LLPQQAMRPRHDGGRGVGGEATATTLAGDLPVTRQAVANHLAVLERAGLVEGRRSGREVRYAVRPEQLDAATRWMSRVAAEWDDRLGAIKRLAESSHRERPSPRKTRHKGD